MVQYYLVHSVKSSFLLNMNKETEAPGTWGHVSRIAFMRKYFISRSNLRKSHNFEVWFSFFLAYLKKSIQGIGWHTNSKSYSWFKMPLTEEFSTGDKCSVTNSSLGQIWVNEQECKYKVEQIIISFEVKIPPSHYF